MMNKNKISLLLAMTASLMACNKQPDADSVDTSASASESLEVNALWPALQPATPDDPALEKRVDALLAEMTLEQKIAQMIQPEIRDITVEDMRKYGFGSYLNGGGSFPRGDKYATVEDWLTYADDMYQASIDASLDGSAIPTMWGTDAVHGHNNVIGATLFPHNIGLGAARNPELIRQIAKATATEVAVTGIEWIFAPTVAVAQDDRWGRTYESYSEDPALVRDYAAAVVEGLQGRVGEGFLAPDRVISTVKHFIGDGGTERGDDQGDNQASEQTLFDIHAQGYVGGLGAGAQTVMASFNSWHGEKVHGHKYLLTGVLKQRFGFDGFVVGDWSGHGQVKGCSNESCPQSINAGLDMFMAPTPAWKPLYENTLKQAQDGTIPMSRIDDAVRRILRVKVRAGLFELDGPAKRPLAGKTALLGQASHRAIAAQAVRESLVLLKNDQQLLPLAPGQRILMMGDGANNIAKQSGGWTITWQGTGNQNSDFPGASSIYDGIKTQVEAAGGQVILSTDGSFAEKPDVAIVVYGEDPYAEGHGDRDNLDFQRGDAQVHRQLLALKAQGIPVVSIFISGRPMWVNPELNASDAFVAAWLPGSEGAAIADVLLRDPAGNVQQPISGKLSFSWPGSPSQQANIADTRESPLFPYGFGLTYEQQPSEWSPLPEEFKSNEGTVLARPLFRQKVYAPWLLWLASGSDRQQVTTNTLSLGAISYRTTDRNIQEDAMQLTWDGTELGSVALVSKSSFREDLRGDLAANLGLVFDINIAELGDAPLLLTTACEPMSSCFAQADLKPLLETLESGAWQRIAVPLICLKEKGMKFGDTVMPFSLQTIGTAKLQLSDIEIRALTGTENKLVCH